MTEWKNIISVNCKEIEGKWKCELNRILSDKPREVDKQLCYSTTQEIIEVDYVELKPNTKKCILDDTGKEKYFKCE